jgi:hypothetical protein
MPCFIVLCYYSKKSGFFAGLFFSILSIPIVFFVAVGMLLFVPNIGLRSFFIKHYLIFFALILGLEYITWRFFIKIMYFSFSHAAMRYNRPESRIGKTLHFFENVFAGK